MAKNTPIPAKFLRDPVHFLALGLGSGMPRFMPGTWGTLAGLAVFILVYFLFGALNWIVHTALVLATFLIGIYLCGKTADDLGVHDHGGIVWDEFVGLWLALICVPITWYWLLLGFLLFRLFDIFKPWPIAYIDRQLTGGLGIMFDDIIAGAYTWIVLQVLISLF